MNGPKSHNKSTIKPNVRMSLPSPSSLPQISHTFHFIYVFLSLMTKMMVIEELLNCLPEQGCPGALGRLPLCGRTILLEGLKEPGPGECLLRLQSGCPRSSPACGPLGLPQALGKSLPLWALVPHPCEGRMTSVVFKISSKQETLSLNYSPPHLFFFFNKIN